MVTIRELNRILNRFTDSPEGVEYELRMNLAEIIIQNLKRHGWTQRKLADEAGKAESVITRIVHGQQNCSFHTVGEILYALGARASLIQNISETAATFGNLRFPQQYTEDTHGKEEISRHEDSTQEAIVLAKTAVSADDAPRRLQVAQTG